MENMQLERRIAAGLPLVARMVNHRGEVGPATVGKSADSIQSAFHQIQAGPQHGGVYRHTANSLRRQHVTVEHAGEASELPTTATEPFGRSVRSR
jgi:hypothetical protein